MGVAGRWKVRRKSEVCKGQIHAGSLLPGATILCMLLILNTCSVAICALLQDLFTVKSGTEVPVLLLCPLSASRTLALLC